MARKIEPSPNTLKNKFVHIENLGKLRSDGPQSMFQFGITDKFLRRFNCGGFALDVSQDVGNLRDISSHIGFELCDLIVGLLEGHALVEFDVLLDVKVAGKILHADVVNIEIFMRGDSTNAIKNVFGALRTRQRLNGHVGVRQDTTHGLGDCGGQLTGALKRNGAGEADSEIGEVAISGATDADAVHFDDSWDAQDRIVNLRSNTGGSRIEQGVNRTAGEAPADRNYNSSHKKRGNRVSVTEPIETIIAAKKNQEQSDHDNTGRPDVRGKVERISLERLTVVLDRDSSESARTPPVHSHGKKHHAKCRGRRFNLDVAKEKAQASFVDDPCAGDQQEGCLDKGREVFNFTVTILVIGIGGLVGNS